MEEILVDEKEWEMFNDISWRCHKTELTIPSGAMYVFLLQDIAVIKEKYCHEA